MPNQSSQVILTPREREAACHCACGLLAKQIGALMAITDKTVEKHLINAYRKLDIHDRIDLAHYALHHGWIQNKFAKAIDNPPPPEPSSLA